MQAAAIAAPGDQLVDSARREGAISTSSGSVIVVLLDRRANPILVVTDFQPGVRRDGVERPCRHDELGKSLVLTV
jgi:hypothetical protein